MTVLDGLGTVMILADGQNGDDQGGGRWPGADEGRKHPFWDGSVRIFDPEGFNKTWSGVLPYPTDYVEGTREAEAVAAAVDELYPLLEHRSPLDYMQPTTDIHGRGQVNVGLSTAGMAGVVVLLREALIARGVLAGDAA
jgi:hypothetical protein